MNNCPEWKSKKNGANNGGTNGSPSDPPAPRKDTSKVLCFNCKDLGHYARDCIEPHRKLGRKKP